MLYLPWAYCLKGLLQGFPKGVLGVENSPTQPAAHHGPQVFDGVHVGAAGRPEPLVKHPNSLVFDELEGPFGPVN